jgi:hypothetical protein
MRQMNNLKTAVAIARAGDVLAEARNCIECICLAAATLMKKRTQSNAAVGWLELTIVVGCLPGRDRERHPARA